jgi:hypothetical protein
MTRYVFHGHAGVELISQELNTFLEELDSKMKEEEA